jgi:hemerythrin-like domain-containing protein
MDAQERLLLPRLAPENPEAARALHDDHELIRSRLLELDVGVDLHLVRCNAARAFLDELRAHARHEDEMLYFLADRHLTREERHAVIETLAPGTVVHSVRPSALGEQRV